jgi:DNA-binding beta-propeller fold protein YncE
MTVHDYTDCHRRFAAVIVRQSRSVIMAVAILIAVAISNGHAMAAQPDGANENAASDQEHPFPRHVAAPELTGGIDWINTSRPLALKDLRGKFVLLDFWTYCCINCMHILPELKKLEEAFPNQLVVIGVHSAKFANEEDSKNITEAVLRYEIKHPVVNDAKHAIWDSYSVRSWPSAYLIDPEGQAFYLRNGEFKAAEFEALLKRGIPYYRKKGTLNEKPLRFDLAADRATDTPLRFPGKVLADQSGGRLFIADSNHNRVVVAKLDGMLVDVIGGGAIGTTDGDFATATFNHPQGMALDGHTLYVADTENHMLRKVDLAKRAVTTIAGVGRQAQAWPGIDPQAFAAGEGKLPDRFVGPPRETELNSPWDLAIHGRDLYIAMAGPHQIWKMPLDESEIGPYSGNSREDIVDGPLLPSEPYEAGYASFAQPSGLASDGQMLYVADSEGSSIRAVPFDATGQVHTVVGTASLPAGRRLFTFGDRDGTGRQVRLQHPLGVAFAEGVLYVADTYNNKIKTLAPGKQKVSTIAGTGKPGREDSPATFDEPAGLSAAGGKLYVADTNNHLIRTIDVHNANRVATLTIAGLAPPKADKQQQPAVSRGQEIRLDPVSLAPQDSLVWLDVELTLPAGYKINPQAPMQYTVTAAGNSGPIDRAGLIKRVKVDPPEREFLIELPLSQSTGKDTIDVTLDYYYCQEGESGICKAGRVTWSVPLSVNPAATQSTTPLRLKVE